MRAWAVLLGLCLVPGATAQDSVTIALTATVERPVQLVSLPPGCACACVDGDSVLTCVAVP